MRKREIRPDGPGAGPAPRRRRHARAGPTDRGAHRGAVAPAPVPAATPARRRTAARSTLLYGVGPVLGGAAVLGAGVYAGQRLRRRRRGLDEPAAPGGTGRRRGPAGTASPRPSSPGRWPHRLHGEPDPATLVAGRVRRFYAEHGIELGVVLGPARPPAGRPDRWRRGSTTRPAWPSSPTSSAAGGARARAEPAAQNDVRLTLSASHEPTCRRPEDAAEAPWLVPVGALPGGEVVYVDWRELDHVLVAGRPGEGAETVLTSLVAAWPRAAARRSCGCGRFAHRRALPPELERLPHQLGGLVDPADHEARPRRRGEVRAELERRIRGGDPGAPRLVLVVGELADVEGGQLATIGEYGPAGASTCSSPRPAPTSSAPRCSGHFRTRAVLRLGGEGASTRSWARPARSSSTAAATAPQRRRAAPRSPARLRCRRTTWPSSCD